MVPLFPEAMYTCGYIQVSSQEVMSTQELGSAVCSCCVSKHVI